MTNSNVRNSEAPEQEGWRDIEGYPHYQVSNTGRVRSQGRYARTGRGKRKVRGRVLSPHSIYGYPCVDLYNEGRKKTVRIHALVLTAFVGPRPDGMECRHLDGSRDNNHVENLAWGTRKENCRDKLRHGTLLNGSKSPRSKVDETQVREIVCRCNSGEAQGSVADDFGIDQSTVSDIMTGRSWSHITGQEA